uniref:PTS fructose transporter subunit IIC n=1 Tax=Anaerostipes caccae TaxID=105841 RepID=UPI003AB8CA9C
MLPFVVAGGILVALGFLLGGYDIPNTVEPGRNFASTIFWIGKIGLGTFMVPILGAYVAFSIADKPGICVGMFGGWLATDPWGMGYSSGFIGALIAGIIAGYLVNALKKIPLPNAVRSLLPTLIIPVIGCAGICLLMHYVIGGPLGALTGALTTMLNNLGTGNLVLLGIVQGCMLAFDMGGPCNKVAYAFALACMETGNYAPMAANFVACCAPPLAMAFLVPCGVRVCGSKKHRLTSLPAVHHRIVDQQCDPCNLVLGQYHRKLTFNVKNISHTCRIYILQLMLHISVQVVPFH